MTLKILLVVLATCTIGGWLGMLVAEISAPVPDVPLRTYLVGAGIAVGLALLFMLLGESIVEDVVKGLVISGLALLLYFGGIPGAFSLAPIVGVVVGTVGNATARGVSGRGL
ncbi:MAG: hypothetical protein GTN62_09485 [Gemmatimonadales bacterium]|nr:hypothetical protein [Gemmatimonadales bacterium]NIN11770.1 hypothetical protein [Gemmatimonadales bacterium]NIN50326.1 hypothetical protein [Gemmatimonadales bacterium]NIP07790.1 hypothetical protein [Gemmatimonadales bacterium]NIQ99222.1 hypothetical protein [Gemmatimonadales bacterium]